MDIGNIVLKAIEPHTTKFTMRFDITYEKIGKTSKPVIVYEMFYNEDIVMRELVQIGTKYPISKILEKLLVGI